MADDKHKKKDDRVDPTYKTVVDFAGSPGNSTDVFNQDLQHLELSVKSLTTQVQRVFRLIDVDEREGAVADKQSNRELLQAVTNNSRLVETLVKERREDARSLEDDTDFYEQQKYKQHKQAQKRLQHDLLLQACRQEITEVCPCGQHKGIRFVHTLVEEELDYDKGKPVVVKTEVEEVLDELCPRTWWVIQSRIAYEEGRLGEFTESTPIKDYIKLFEPKKEGNKKQ